MHAQRTVRPAFRNGLLFGAIIAAVSLVYIVTQTVVGDTMGSGADATALETALGSAVTCLDCVVIVGALALFFVAGMTTARATGRVDSGALGGLWTGLTAGIILCIVGLVALFTLQLPTYHFLAASGISPSDASTKFLTSSIFENVLAVPVFACLGAGVGALGGLVGKHTSSGPAGPAASDQDSRYPGVGGQPGYPPEPTYPGQQ